MYETHPNIRDEFTPLNSLIMSALRRYGDFNPGTIAGDVSLMLLEFANLVIDEVNQHPYREGMPRIPYYVSLEDARDIPDPIIIVGMMAHYATQQMSQKMEIYVPMYNKTMNRLLWDSLNGNTKLRGKVVDGGSNSRYSNGQITDPVNGTITGTRGDV